MMKRYLTILASALLLASCNVAEICNPEVNDGDIVFYAGFEGQQDTKTYLNEDGLMRWTADDRLSIFAGKTYNQQYSYDGETGANNGSFSKVGNPEFVSGSMLSNNIAVYPYSSDTFIDDEGAIHLSLPEAQAYAENSFGLNANTMVAATENKEDNFLLFKNACGYLRISLYGDAVIKSVSLKGNNGEKIAGAATIVAPYGQLPSLTMTESATDVITINCGDGVQIGTTAETATSFLFVVPETEFSKGITIRATYNDGLAFEKSAEKRVAVSRNKISWMSALEFKANEVNINIPDPTFKAYCVENFDTNGDGEISYKEAGAVRSIYCDGRNIESLEGVQFFTGLWELGCNSNQLTSLDVSKNTMLTCLYCASNQLTSLDVSKNTMLTYLQCSSNQLTSLDVSKNTALSSLYCHGNQLTSLDLSKNTALSRLSCERNQLTSLDVSNSTALSSLSCNGNQLTSLDVSNNTALADLFCFLNQLTSLDVSKNTALSSLYCYGNQLTSLDVSNNTMLRYFRCSSNQLTSLDVSNNLKLSDLYCSPNPYLTEIWLKTGQSIETFSYDGSIATIKYKGIDDVVNIPDPAFKAYCVTNFDTDSDGEISKSEAGVVKKIDCHLSGIKSLEGIQFFTSLDSLICHSNVLTNLDVSYNTALTHLECGSNQLTSLNVSGCVSLITLKCRSNLLSSLDVSKNKTLDILDCSSNSLTSLDVSSTTAMTMLDCSSNSLTNLDVSYNTALTHLECGSNQLTSIGVSNNTALTYLDCHSNLLSSLDVSKNTALDILNCSSNRLTSLDVRKNVAMTILKCGSNQLATLDVSGNESLQYFTCDSNQLTSLGLGNNTVLATFSCSSNRLTSLDVSTLPALDGLGCGDNQLTRLDVSKNTVLRDLDCWGNQLTDLDVSKCTALKDLRCFSNQLASLDLSNNTALTVLYCYSNPHLAEIWLKTGQSIRTIRYDNSVATIKYKD